MESNVIYETIKQTINNYLPDARILLFGSHARGDNDSQSDYDLLIITPNLMAKEERQIESRTLHRALVKGVHAPFDLLFFSEDEIKQKKELPGHIIGTAIREGIIL